MKLAITETGSAGARAVVFLHAFPMNAGMWSAQQEALSKDYHTLALDFPGYGKTPPDSRERYSIEDFGDGVIQTIRDHGIGSAVFVGCSIGGYVIFDLFRRYPDMINAAVLCDTRAESDSSEARGKRRDLIMRLETEGTGWYPDSVVAGLLSPGAETREPALVEKVRRWAAQPPVSTLTATVELLANRPDSTANLASITVPVLILVGEYDKATPREAAEVMHQGITQSKMHLIEGAGHLSPSENPDTVNRHLMEFLKSLPDAGSRL
jgi:3-oxoadipate enol-lactonase